MNNQKQNRFKGLKKAVSIFAMGTICVATAVSVAAFSKTVTVTDGTKKTTVNTLSPDTSDILNKSGTTLGKNDKLVLTEDSGSNAEISILRAFNVDSLNGNNANILAANEGTVAQAVKAAGMTISANDKVSLSSNTQRIPDTKIQISEWYSVNFNIRGKKSVKQVPAGTVQEALDFLGVKMGKNDVLNVSKDKKISDNFNITVQTVTHKDVESTETISYKTINKDTSELYKGETKVDTDGENGVRTIVTRETYINGKLSSKKEVSNKITKEAVNEVVLNGTAEKVSKVQTNSGSISVNETDKKLTDVNGKTVSYSRVLTGSGTAYTAPAGASTSTGRLAQYGVVAVNPNVIPYGSNLYIVSNDGEIVYGYAVAGDTGGAMMAGDAICDLYYPTFDDCSVFGRRDITIYVLN